MNELLKVPLWRIFSSLTSYCLMLKFNKLRPESWSVPLRNLVTGSETGLNGYLSDIVTELLSLMVSQWLNWSVTTIKSTILNVLYVCIQPRTQTNEPREVIHDQLHQPADHIQGFKALPVPALT